MTMRKREEIEEKVKELGGTPAFAGYELAYYELLKLQVALLLDIRDSLTPPKQSWWKSLPNEEKERIKAIWARILDDA